MDKNPIFKLRYNQLPSVNESSSRNGVQHNLYLKTYHIPHSTNAIKAGDQPSKNYLMDSRTAPAEIQGMKNAVAKNDKRRRKQLVEEVAKIEAELELRHKEELKQLSLSLDKPSMVEFSINGIANLELEINNGKEAKQFRVSKAQKRREKKAAQEKEREERIAEADIENLKGARHLESQQVAEILAARNLQMKQIPSDGHCMYKAIEDQLRNQNSLLTLVELRSQAAEYMRSHMDDFLPFLTNSTGDMYTPDEFEKYCHEVANTPAWGGQLELRALSHVLKVPVEVIQADSTPIIIGEEYRKKPIILVYMRHAYGLGEHYNSVEQLNDPATEDVVPLLSSSL
ncbi:deubiquitinase OTUD6B-like isoform X4 [Narcine bancroftii]|uniref:deubiquitinase OTUD6B-like isoform X4 n=1 Tax=Narcine bancroftii TaxID=1343680 RepID=UPI003831F3E5